LFLIQNAMKHTASRLSNLSSAGRWLLFSLLASPLPASAEPLRYNRDIRPILSDACFACHGPDTANQKGGLRLDMREPALQPAKSGAAAIVPGDASKSELITRIESRDKDELMPPPKAHKTVTPEQRAKLRQWITEGAAYEKHWAFIPPSPAEPPAVKHPDWPRHALDRFVLNRLEAAGLPPSPEAPKEALIRRVTLDLTGLPPTPAEVDAFLADAAPEAYERVVDRLLKSPHYGERMAVDWLDAARYADTNGYQVDRDRELWPWRDWVIRAFNDNKKFDQFTIEQIAGDLLPEATLEQKIATGFHRNHMLNEEGGVIGDEFLAEYTADRVETTAAVWLGQTFNCARCHDHKYDPFTQRDFYSLKAFFHNVPERGVGIYSNPVRTNAPPFVKLPAPDIEARIADLNTKHKSVNDSIAALAKNSSDGVEEWASRVASSTVHWEPVKILEASGGDQPPVLDTAANTVAIGPQETRSNTIKITVSLPHSRPSALRFECATGASSASFQWSELTAAGLTLRAASAGDSLATAEGEKVLDGDRKTKAALSMTASKPVQAVFELEKGEPKGQVVINIGVENAGGPSRWSVFSTVTDKELLVPSTVLAAAKIENHRRSAADKKLLADFRLSQDPKHRTLKDQLATLNKQAAALEGEIPTTLVMEEMKEPRPTHILMRGAYDKPGEKVAAAPPAVLPPLAKDLPANRLGFAKWLVSADNPLTARVAVNRFWQQVFGGGLVKTSEDFGAQGALPSHPELLDWLALEFIRSGWDVKALMKLMVTSATYRQHSAYSPETLKTDPDNRLLSRGPRHRLMAEFIRDQALAAGGLLVPKIGGPSVKPYHPPGLYEQVVAQRDNPKATYTQGAGDDLRRRSLYTYWKRSVPHPAMMLFDAPFRETCAMRRSRSNTPLQALNLLNDPTYVEAARWIAHRMLTEGSHSDESRITHGFRLLLSRRPNPRELTTLTGALERHRRSFLADPEAAKQFLGVGETKTPPAPDPAELAALTMVASTLLNLDETVTKP
jgi:mono/diheme cytochrome c family protein